MMKLKLSHITTADADELAWLMKKVHEAFKAGEYSVTLYAMAYSDLDPENEEETLQEALQRIFDKK